MAQYTGMRPEQVNGKDAEQIKGYLVRLDRQMRYLFGNLDEENMSGSFLKKIESGGIGSEIKQEFDSIRMKVSGQDDSISEFKINLNGVSSTVQAQGGKISTLEQTAENLSGRIETAEGNYSALSQTVEGFKTEVQETVSSQNERISTAESNYSSLSQTVSGLSSTVSSVKTTANNAASKANSAAAKADSALSDAKNYTDRQLETVKGELSAEIEQTPSRIQLSVLRTGYFPVFDVGWVNYTAGTFGNKITASTSGLVFPYLRTTDAETLSYARGNTLQGYLSYQIHTAIVGKASDSYFRFAFVAGYTDGTYLIQSLASGDGQGTYAAVCSKTNAALNLAVADKEVEYIQVEIQLNKCSGVIEVGEVWANVAELNGKASTLTLTADGAKISSANIVMKGAVSFEDLSGTGRTIINGSNIVTGNVKASLLDASEISHSYSGWNLATGHIRSGKSAGTRVEIDPGSINWYTDNYLTGVLYSKIGSTYIGANSRYVFVGWFSNGKPSFSWNQSAAETSDFGGIAIEMNAGVCTIHCNASKFEIPGRIECSSLAVSGREI